MNEPIRLRDLGDPLDEALLRAGRDDDAPEGLSERTLAALGLSVGLGAASVVGGVAAEKAAAGAIVSKSAGVSSSVSLGKWLFGTALVASATVGGLSLTKPSAFEQKTAKTPSANGWDGAGVGRGAPAHAPQPQAVEVQNSPRASEALAGATNAPARSPRGGDARVDVGRQAVPSAQPKRTPMAPKNGAASANVGSGGVVGGGLDAEIAVLERARAALNRGDAAAAVVVLDDYATRFPQGALAAEARTLRQRATSSVVPAP